MSAPARSSTARARDALNARRAAGGRDVRVILSPAAAKALDSLTRQHGITMTDAIDTALRYLDGQRWEDTAAECAAVEAESRAVGLAGTRR